MANPKKDKPKFNAEQAKKDEKEPLNKLANGIASAGIVKTLLDDIKAILEIFK